MAPQVYIGLIMFLALTAYAVFGGADFGGGIWDLLARGPRAARQREAIADAMGPVWEANHVWLIFFTIILFTAFPTAFAALASNFFLPAHLVLVGIILRGAAFVFRSYGAEQRTWGAAFGAASAITPFLLGATMGVVSYGGDWLGPLPLGFGAMFLSLSAFLAAVYLTLETDGEVQEDFRLRALGAAAAVALIAAVLLPIIRRHAPTLWYDLTHIERAPVFYAGAALAGLSFWAIYTRRYSLGRAAAVAQITVLLAGWAFAQWPYIIYPDYTVWNSAAPPDTLQFLLTVLPLGLVLTVPSLILLFYIFKRPLPPA